MAKQPIRIIVLKALATFSVISVTTPFFLFLQSLILDDYNRLLTFTVYVAVVCVIYLWGMLMSYWSIGVVHSKAWQSSLTVCSKLSVVLVFVPLFVLTFAFELNPILLLYGIPIVLLPFISGYLAYGKTYTGIFTRGWLAAFCVCDLIGYFLFSSIEENAFYETGRLIFLIITASVIIISGLLINQTNIDNQIKQRRDNLVLIPRGLRRFNITLITITSIFLVACFLFNGYISDAIGSALKSFVNWLFAYREQNLTEVIDAEDKSGVGNGILDMTNNNFVGMIITTVFYIIVALLIIRYGRMVISAVLKFFKNYFKDILNKLSKKGETETAPFVDTFEDLGLRSSSKRERTLTIKELRKKYLSEQDEALKFRYGYQLILMLTNEKRHTLTPYDTTDIQREKTTVVYDFKDEISEIVGIYNNIRYMNTFPQKSDLVKMENLINNIL